MTMVSYLVSVDIKTRSHLLSALSQELGVEPSVGSFDRGTPCPYGRKKGTPHEHTLLRFESTAPETAPLPEHLKSIFSRLSIDRLRSPTALSGDWEIWLTIGMDFPVEEIVYPELVIPPEYVHMLDGTKVGIDITFYPSWNQPAKDENEKANPMKD
jgi:hypothetical protein